MAKVCVAGSGKIGTLIASLLANERRYSVDLVDADLKSLTPWKDSKINTDCFDITDQGQFAKYVKKSSPTAVVACLPYFCDLKVAEYAKSLGLHYFDLTEDVSDLNGLVIPASATLVSCGPVKNSLPNL